MPIPSDAATWLDAMDPADLIDYEANMEPLLETAESINTFTVALMPEAVLLGVEIATGLVDGGNRDPAKVTGTGGAVDKRIKIWMNVLPANREDPIFDGVGVDVGVVFTITTNSAPPRRRQRTYKLTVRQR